MICMAGGTYSDYDPRNVRQFFGRTFVTGSARYGLDKEGKVVGSIGVVGKEVELIAGIEGKFYNYFTSYLNKRDGTKEGLSQLVRDYGSEPNKGKHLVIILKTPIVSEDQTESYGLVSSVIQKVE